MEQRSLRQLCLCLGPSFTLEHSSTAPDPGRYKTRASAVGKNQFFTPLKAIVSFFPNRVFTLYGLMEVAPFWGSEDIVSAYYTQTGIGGKIQVSRSFEIEVLLTTFPFGKNQGAGKTYNVGARYLN